VPARRSQRDRAFDLLEEAAKAGYFHGGNIDLRSDPHLSFLVGDRRLQVLEQRVNADAARRD
jgi:hypothetical protein